MAICLQFELIRMLWFLLAYLQLAQLAGLDIMVPGYYGTKSFKMNIGIF